MYSQYPAQFPQAQYPQQAVAYAPQAYAPQSYSPQVFAPQYAQGYPSQLPTIANSVVSPPAHPQVVPQAHTAPPVQAHAPPPAARPSATLNVHGMSAVLFSTTSKKYELVLKSATGEVVGKIAFNEEGPGGFPTYGEWEGPLQNQSFSLFGTSLSIDVVHHKMTSHVIGSQTFDLSQLSSTPQIFTVPCTKNRKIGVSLSVASGLPQQVVQAPAAPAVQYPVAQPAHFPQPIIECVQPQFTQPIVEYAQPQFAHATVPQQFFHQPAVQVVPQQQFVHQPQAAYTQYAPIAPQQFYQSF